MTWPAYQWHAFQQFQFGSSRLFYPKRAIEIVRYLGLGSSLKLCLDAGDAASLPSSPTKWLDLSGNGYDFEFGADSTHPGTDEPTANGTPGALSASEYLSFGGDDYFTYDTTNEAWMDRLHQNSALFGYAGWIYRPTAASGNFFFPSTNAASQSGLRTGIGSTFRWFLTVGNGTGNALNVASTIDGAADIWMFCAISVNEAAGAAGSFYVIDAESETFDATYSSPSASAAANTMKIGANGNASAFAPAGGRMPLLWVWEGRAPTLGEMMALRNATRGRFGV